jgi:hypothetical protein
MCRSAAASQFLPLSMYHLLIEILSKREEETEIAEIIRICWHKEIILANNLTR